MDGSTSLFFSPGTVPFSIALGLMMAIGLFEFVAMLLGFSGVVDGLLPDLDADLDAPQAGDLSGIVDRALGWLHVGRVPVLILLVVFLAFFGVIGLSLQAAVSGVTGFMLPAGLAVVPAFSGAIPAVRLVGNVLVRVMPKDETDAVRRESFVGRVAVVGQGTARHREPAEGKLRDHRGTTHYVMLEPDVATDVFAPGTEVVIVRQAGAIFFAIENTSAALRAR